MSATRLESEGEQDEEVAAPTGTRAAHIPALSGCRTVDCYKRLNTIDEGVFGPFFFFLFSFFLLWVRFCGSHADLLLRACATCCVRDDDGASFAGMLLAVLV